MGGVNQRQATPRASHPELAKDLFRLSPPGALSGAHPHAAAAGDPSFVRMTTHGRRHSIEFMRTAAGDHSSFRVSVGRGRATALHRVLVLSR
jgi:hypothetical protein